MRLMLAVVTSAILANGAYAQSVAPELQSRGAAAAYAPAVTLAPAIAAPAPIAIARIDRTEIEPASAPVAPKPVEALTAPGAAASAATTAGDQKLQAARKPRTVESRVEPRIVETRAEPRRVIEKSEAAPVQRYRPVASGARELGRFWPPVF